MLMLMPTAAALFFQAAGLAAPPPKTWILVCEVGAQQGAGPAASQTLRVGLHLLQQWKPAEGRFGPNLCLSFPCSVTSDGLQGTVSSASMAFSVKLDRQASRASWRTLGASGNSRTSGPCTVRADDGKKPR